MSGEIHPATHPGHSTSWTKLAGKTARKVNLGWFVQAISTPLLACGVLSSVGILIGRTQEISTAFLAGIAIPSSIVISCAMAWWSIRKRFETPDQALVRIETSLGLHNALSAASQGIAPWPQPPAAPPCRMHLALRWQWRRLAAAPVITLIMLAASLWIPVRTIAEHPAHPTIEPLAWAKLGTELDRLAKTAIIAQNDLDQTVHRLQDLRSQDPGEWYSHHSMEATDTLTRAHRDQISRLRDNLGHAANALKQMRDNDPDMRVTQFQGYQSALEELANGAMRPNEELRKLLATIDPEQLNRQQLVDLCEQLRNAQLDLNQAQGVPETCENETPTQGTGEPTEDGDHASQMLGANPNPPMNLGEITPLAAKNLTRAGIGDLIEIQSSRHQPDSSSTGQSISSQDHHANPGHGGDPIWRENLAPAEQRTIRKYFQ